MLVLFLEKFTKASYLKTHLYLLYYVIKNQTFYQLLNKNTYITLKVYRENPFQKLFFMI